MDDTNVTWLSENTTPRSLAILTLIVPAMNNSPISFYNISGQRGWCACTHSVGAERLEHDQNDHFAPNDISISWNHMTFQKTNFSLLHAYIELSTKIPRMAENDNFFAQYQKYLRNTSMLRHKNLAIQLHVWHLACTNRSHR